jgi:hypothetical protein
MWMEMRVGEAHGIIFRSIVLSAKNNEQHILVVGLNSMVLLLFTHPYSHYCFSCLDCITSILSFFLVVESIAVAVIYVLIKTSAEYVYPYGS